MTRNCLTPKLPLRLEVGISSMSFRHRKQASDTRPKKAPKTAWTRGGWLVGHLAFSLSWRAKPNWAWIHIYRWRNKKIIIKTIKNEAKIKLLNWAWLGPHWYINKSWLRGLPEYLCLTSHNIYCASSEI